MRIVHDIDDPCNFYISNRPYTMVHGEKFSSGFAVSVVITYSNQSFELQGDAFSLLHTLENICAKINKIGSQLEDSKQLNPEWRNVAYNNTLRENKQIEFINFNLDNGWVAYQITFYKNSSIALVTLKHEGDELKLVLFDFNQAVLVPSPEERLSIENLSFSSVTLQEFATQCKLLLK